MAASSSSQAGPTPVVSAPLKHITSYYDSCTFIKAKATNSQDGCYTYRSCQSCLELEGCAINEFGICISEKEGIYNLDTYQYETHGFYYDANKDYTQATAKNLSLPAALTTNAAGLAAQQSWHFRADEASYCSATDPVCQECKQKNFWRSDTTVLPDSRFCVGQNGCVCIQTCEVPTLKPQGCQWKLTPARPSTGYGYGGYGNYDTDSYTYPTDRLAWWNWFLVIAVIIGVHSFFAFCWGERTRQVNLVKKEATRAARGELGLAEDEPMLQQVDMAVPSQPQPQPQPQAVSAPTTTSNSESLKIETPRTENDGSEAAFVEVVDASESTSRTTAGSS